TICNTPPKSCGGGSSCPTPATEQSPPSCRIELPMPSLTSEFAYIEWLRARTPADPRVRMGPGDDAAAVAMPPNLPVLITTDMLLDGSCFRLQEVGPRTVGRKAMAVNLSDIAAMAGVPAAAVVSVGLPREGGRALAEELYHGLREMADCFR